jgi:hypothetical protein
MHDSMLCYHEVFTCLADLECCRVLLCATAAQSLAHYSAVKKGSAELCAQAVISSLSLLTAAYLAKVNRTIAHRRTGKIVTPSSSSTRAMHCVSGLLLASPATQTVDVALEKRGMKPGQVT